MKTFYALAGLLATVAALPQDSTCQNILGKIPTSPMCCTGEITLPALPDLSILPVPKIPKALTPYESCTPAKNLNCTGDAAGPFCCSAEPKSLPFIDIHAHACRTSS